MSAAIAAPAWPSPWRRTLAWLVTALAAVLLLYGPTFTAMVAIWARSDTFAHAFLVPPIALWLAWRDRARLQALSPRPAPWVLLPMALAAGAWLAGDLAGVNAVTQLAATALLVLCVPALAGTAVARALLFPLAFLFFMVPIGEFVMPQLMQWTADVTVFALRSLGIPVYREGLQFVIPSGTWSVIEACSGVRYLIASFMVGTLFAYLSYRTLRRRLAFALVSLLVPIVANWLRAIMIVLLGHFSDNRIATGADHLLYGWVFFGIVIGLMFFIGARWQESPVAAPEPASVSPAPAGALAAAPWGTAVLLLLVLLMPPALERGLAPVATSVPRLALPDLPGAPAAADAEPLHRPYFEGARAEAVRVYGSGAGEVTVHVAYYRDQTYGHKLTSSQNVLVKSDDHQWHRTSAGTHEVSVGGALLPLRSAVLTAGTVAGSIGARRLQVRQAYWVDGRLAAADDHAALVRVLLGRLAGRGDDAAAITLYAVDDPEGRGAAALDAFAARHLAELAAWLATVPR